MDEQENNLNIPQDVPAEETENPSVQTQELQSEIEQAHKYVDRSEETDGQEEQVQAGAVWEGPAYVPGDEDAERRRVQAIIAQNAQRPESAAPEETAREEAEKPEDKKKKSKTRLIIGIALAVVLVGAIAAAVVHFTRPEKTTAQQTGKQVQTIGDLSPTENTGNTQDGEDTEEAPTNAPLFSTLEDKTEEQYKAENLPREISIPTPLEFFTAGKTFNEYSYEYFYIQALVVGYDVIEGMRCILLQTAIGNVILLDSMFTIPDLSAGSICYFYYLYAGYDSSLGVVFGEYVDYSLENEGIPEIRSYSDGTYVVGKDLDAGEYFFSPTSADGVTLDLYADGRYIEKLVSGTFYGGYFLTLKDGQVLVVSGVRFAVSTAISLTAPAVLHDFMYRVGKDIEPGTYRVYTDGTPDSFYEIYDSSDPLERTLLASGDPGQGVYVTVEEGQYFNLVHAMAEPAEGEGEEQPETPQEETSDTEKEAESEQTDET